MIDTYTDEKLQNMMNASYLLPDPGGEVVRDLIEMIRKLGSENTKLKQHLPRLLSAAQDAARYLDEHAPENSEGVRFLSVSIAKVQVAMGETGE